MVTIDSRPSAKSPPRCCNDIVSYHRLTTRIPLFCCVLVLLGVNADSTVVSREETTTTNSREFTKSIRQIEALPDQDEVGWHQAEAALRRAMLNPSLKENAICGLAWLYLRRGNAEAVSRSCYPSRQDHCRKERKKAKKCK